MKGTARCGHKVDETEYVQNGGLCAVCVEIEPIPCEGCGNLVDPDELDEHDHCESCQEKACPICGEIEDLVFDQGSRQNVCLDCRDQLRIDRWEGKQF